MLKNDSDRQFWRYLKQHLPSGETLEDMASHRDNQPLNQCPPQYYKHKDVPAAGTLQLQVKLLYNCRPSVGLLDPGKVSTFPYPAVLKLLTFQ